MNQRDPAQIEKIHTVLTMKRERVKQQIMRLNQSIQKKQQSIAKLTEYQQSYEGSDAVTKTVEIFKNNQQFYMQLFKVVDSEKQELIRLEHIKTDLIKSYTELDKKMDGLDSIIQEIQKEQSGLRDKRDDSAMNELSVLQVRKEKLWKR